MTTKAEIREAVVAVVVTVLQLEETVWNEADTFEELGGDSLDIVQIVASVEDEFKLPVDDIDLFELNTVSKLVAYVADGLGMTA